MMTPHCTHTMLRRVTPGGRCPLCSPREDPALALLEREITPARLIREDARIEMRDGIDREAEIVAINAEIKVAEHLLGVADGADCIVNFGAFVRQAWHVVDPSGRAYVENPGSDAIIQHLQALADGQITLLGIACSPGFGKTTLASICFPAFMWARDPAWSAICASYAFQLAEDIARRFRRLVTSDWYLNTFPYVELAGESLKAMPTKAGGMRYAVGVEGAVTGMRARCGLIDDSLNAIDAGSKLAVRSTNQWFEESFSTRFDPGPDGSRPSIAVIQQRLAENDLIAIMRALGAEILELPARYDSSRRSSTKIWADPRVEDGELLAPEIHSEDYLAERERIMGARAFAGQYLQSVAPREGNQFKVGMWGWCALSGDGAQKARPMHARGGAAHVLERRRDGSLELDWACVSVDATGGSTADDASALGLGIIGGRGMRKFVLEDLTDGPAGWNATRRRVRAAILRAAEICGKQRRIVVLLEKKAMGASEEAPLPTQIKEDLASGELCYPDGTKIIAKLELYEPVGKGSKQQRADAMEPDVEAGLVHLLDGALWVGAFVEEFGLFGAGGMRDDRIDYMSQAIDFFRTTGRRRSFGARVR